MGMPWHTTTIAPSSSSSSFSSLRKSNNRKTHTTHSHSILPVYWQRYNIIIMMMLKQYCCAVVSSFNNSNCFPLFNNKIVSYLNSWKKMPQSKIQPWLLLSCFWNIYNLFSYSAERWSFSFNYFAFQLMNRNTEHRQHVTQSWMS